MKIVWRLTQDHRGLLSGSCITEEAYKGIYYTDKCLWEPVRDFEIRDMIEYKDERYCVENNIECLLFYTSMELDLFLKKVSENGCVD